MQNLFKAKKRKKQMIDWNLMPKHIGVMMDGNGRWATQRGLTRSAGHYAVMVRMRDFIRICREYNIQTVTLYAFSSENWKRPADEVNYLMKLPELFFKQEIQEMMSKNIKTNFIGNIHQLPKDTLKVIQDTYEMTKNNTGMTVNFALNYGGRNEILLAVKSFAADVKNGIKDVRQFSESTFTEYLQFAGMEDPGLIIRTSGEQRLSNFMVWQSAYSELWFTNNYWPDFEEDMFLDAICDYQKRIKRKHVEDEGR